MIQAAQTVNMFAQLPLLIVVISLVYSATRHDEWDQILGEAFRWGIRMLGFILAVAAVLFLAAYLIRA